LNETWPLALVRLWKLCGAEENKLQNHNPNLHTIKHFENLIKIFKKIKIQGIETKVLSINLQE
jgi:hypothetical protein